MLSLDLAPGSRATLIRMWHSTDVILKPYPRGFHLITREVVAALPELASIQTGLLHVFIRHTSASLTLGENSSPDVRRDFERYFNHQGHRKVDEAVKILLTANSGEERLAMKSGFFESAPVGS